MTPTVGKGTPIVRRRAILVCLLLTALAACSDDDAAPSTPTTAPAVTLAPDATDITGNTLAPQTTFMPDCAAMPTAADLSTIVGLPLDDGHVTGSGTCEFLGLNDQSRSVVLAMLTDPGDQASFTDLQSSLGAVTPLDDSELAGASVSANSTVFVTANGALYSVLTSVTDGTPAEQVPLSVAVLKRWLAI